MSVTLRDRILRVGLEGNTLRLRFEDYVRFGHFGENIKNEFLTIAGVINHVAKRLELKP